MGKQLQQILTTLTTDSSATMSTDTTGMGAMKTDTTTIVH